MPVNPDRWLRAGHVGLPIEGRYTLIRSAWDLPSPTLTASGQRLRGGNGVIHPAEHRKFTVPEIKRLFGLPDDYVLTGTMDQAVERMGRMIPPFLMQAIAESVYQRVLLPYRELQP